mmetsp:Transcript_64316/g.106418  ORF Transcript_64316/g.106418 Transcript_64316/m.106418 type:complete len:1335 (+) Transcript_64316:6881-10885(+)
MEHRGDAGGRLRKHLLDLGRVPHVAGDAVDRDARVRRLDGLHDKRALGRDVTGRGEQDQMPRALVRGPAAHFQTKTPCASGHQHTAVCREESLGQTWLASLGIHGAWLEVLGDLHDDLALVLATCHELESVHNLIRWENLRWGGLQFAVGQHLSTLVDQRPHLVWVGLIQQIQMNREERDVLLQSTQTHALVHEDVTLADFHETTAWRHTFQRLSLSVTSKRVQHHVHATSFSEFHHLGHKLRGVAGIHHHMAAHIQQCAALLSIPSTSDDAASGVQGDLQGCLSHPSKCGVDENGVLLGKLSHLDQSMPSCGHHSQETSGFHKGEVITFGHQHGLALLGDTLRTEKSRPLLANARGHRQTHHLVSNLEVLHSATHAGHCTSTLHPDNGLEVAQHSHGQHDVLEMHGHSAHLHLHLVLAHVLEVRLQWVPVQRAQLPWAADLQSHIFRLRCHTGTANHWKDTWHLPLAIGAQLQLLVWSLAPQQLQHLACGLSGDREWHLQGQHVQPGLVTGATAPTPQRERTVLHRQHAAGLRLVVWDQADNRRGLLRGHDVLHQGRRRPHVRAAVDDVLRVRPGDAAAKRVAAQHLHLQRAGVDGLLLLKAHPAGGAAEDAPVVQEALRDGRPGVAVQVGVVAADQNVPGAGHDGASVDDAVHGLAGHGLVHRHEHQLAVAEGADGRLLRSAQGQLLGQLLHHSVAARQSQNAHHAAGGQGVAHQRQEVVESLGAWRWGGLETQRLQLGGVQPWGLALARRGAAQRKPADDDGDLAGVRIVDIDITDDDIPRHVLQGSVGQHLWGPAARVHNEHLLDGIGHKHVRVKPVQECQGLEGTVQHRWVHDSCSIVPAAVDVWGRDAGQSLAAITRHTEAGHATEGGSELQSAERLQGGVSRVEVDVTASDTRLLCELRLELGDLTLEHELGLGRREAWQETREMLVGLRIAVAAQRHPGAVSDDVEGHTALGVLLHELVVQRQVPVEPSVLQHVAALHSGTHVESPREHALAVHDVVAQVLLLLRSDQQLVAALGRLTSSGIGQCPLPPLLRLRHLQQCGGTLLIVAVGKNPRDRANGILVLPDQRGDLEVSRGLLDSRAQCLGPVDFHATREESTQRHQHVSGARTLLVQAGHVLHLVQVFAQVRHQHSMRGHLQHNLGFHACCGQARHSDARLFEQNRPAHVLEEVLRVGCSALLLAEGGRQQRALVGGLANDSFCQLQELGTDFVHVGAVIGPCDGQHSASHRGVEALAMGNQLLDGLLLAGKRHSSGSVDAGHTDLVLQPQLGHHSLGVFRGGSPRRHGTLLHGALGSRTSVGDFDQSGLVDAACGVCCDDFPSAVTHCSRC